MKNKPTNCSYLRFFDALPTSDGFDVFLDQILCAKDIWYEDFTPYKPFEPGEHQLILKRHGDKEALYERTFWLSDSKIYTLVLAYQPDTQLINGYLISDPPKAIPKDHLLMRAANFSQHTLPLTMQLVNTKPRFKKVPLRQVSSYLAFLPTTAPVELSEIDGEAPLICLPNQTYKISRYYTLYIIGGTKEYPLKWVQTIDGNSFIHFNP